MVESQSAVLRFTIQRMMLAVVGFGLVSACFASAYRGNPIGLGFAISLVASSIVFLVYAVVYWGCLLVATYIAQPSNRPRQISGETSTDLLASSGPASSHSVEPINNIVAEGVAEPAGGDDD